jgi:hypothetical protein
MDQGSPRHLFHLVQLAPLTVVPPLGYVKAILGKPHGHEKQITRLEGRGNCSR